MHSSSSSRNCKRRYRRHRGDLLWQPPKCSLFMAFIAVGLAVVFIQPATSQQLNTPPILRVPERNWRISESEQVGQVIARIGAEDAENDELVFGLESQYHYSNYANPNGDGDASDKLPFRIDPVGGVVYLNESLVGRGGESMFFYVTVTDGQLISKKEVLANILDKTDSKQYASN